MLPALLFLPVVHQARCLLFAAWLMFAMSTLAAFAAEPLKWETRPGHRVLKVSPARPGKTGFTQLPAAQLGVAFSNLLTMPTGAKNQNLLSGAGVAAGDFDGDGWCDLYFCTLEGRNTLYRNLGNWRFEDVTESAGVACPGMRSTGAVFADVNGDGLFDLLVTANNGPNALFVNLGGGKFTNITAGAGLVSKPLGSGSMALADLDGNGTLDLFVANYGENTVLRSGGEVPVRMINGKPVVSGRAGRRLKLINGKLVEFGEPSAVYLNDGALHFKPLSWLDGTFRDEDGQPLKELPMDLSLSVMMRDMNGDGVPDIYVCNDFQTPDRFWINDGSARFRAAPRATLRCSSSFSMGVDWADIDRDGRDDFIVADMLSRWHSLRMTQMSDTNMMAAPIGLSEDRPQIRRNTLFWNRGDGTYTEMANLAGVAASDWTWTPAFLDVDLDGFEDLLVSNGHAFDTQDLDVNERPFRPRNPATAALEQLLQYPGLETPNYAFRNRGNLTFEEMGTQWGFDSKQVCHGLVFADLDNDGDLDVVLSSLNAPPVFCRNDSPAPRLAVRLKGAGANTKGIGARIKVTGGAVPVQTQEVICGGRYLSSDEPVRTFAAGTGGKHLSIEVTWRSGRVSVLNDVEPDAIVEIDEAAALPPKKIPAPAPVAPLFADATRALGHRHTETDHDDFARQPLLQKKLSQSGPGVAWFDIDDDGREELFVGAGRGGRLAMLRFDGKGGFTRTEIGDAAMDDLTGVAGWIGRGGQRALLVARAGYEAGAAALLSASTTALTELDGKNLPSASGPVAVADYDGDGALDVFVGGRVNAGRFPEPATSRLFKNRDGNLVVDAGNGRLIENAGLVSGAVWSDLDGDGWPELVLACEWGPLKIFRNDHGKLAAWNPRFTSPLVSRLTTLNDLTGLWQSVTAGDFDGDGRFDLVAGNLGFNTGLIPPTDAPARVFYGDFNGDGTIEPLFAEHDPVTDAVVPRENLTVLGPVLPFLRAKFPTHLAFRGAKVGDLFGERAAEAKALQAMLLATVVLLNRGDHFEVAPLPVEAQLAPVFGVCVADADGDGSEDLFLAQNFFAVRKDIAHRTGSRSVWLRGNGRGGWTAMRGEESGVVVWGEQRGAAVADYDGDGRIDLAVSQNGAETRLFHNERAKTGVRVRLKGPPGNPDGIGAVVRLKSADGSGPARELHAGAGYWSQDGAVTVLAARDGAAVMTRWPGGKLTETPLPAGAREVTVEFKP